MAKRPAKRVEWGLATLAVRGRPVGVIEAGGRCYRLRPSLARVGAKPVSQVARLFADWSMLRIDSGAIGRCMPEPGLLSGGFRPPEMPQAAIEELCRRIAAWGGGDSSI